MIFCCAKHGAGQGALVSPTLARRIARRFPISTKDYVKIEYEYESEIIDAYYLDRETAANFGFLESQRLSLPDDYPDYATEARPVCARCFTEAVGLSGEKDERIYLG
jgi:hypothetical protein